MGEQKTIDHIKINIRMQNPGQEPPESSNAPNQDFKDMNVLCTFKIKMESQNLGQGFIKDQSPSQSRSWCQSPVRSLQHPQKPQMRTYKDMDAFCIFKIEIESEDLNHGYIKDQWPYPNKIKIPNPTQESTASSKAPNEDFMDMDVLCTFKIKKESWNSDHGYIKDQWPYLNKDEYA